MTGHDARREGGPTVLEVRDGLAIGLDDRGRGPPTVLLHGFTGSIAAWGAHPDQLSRHRRVIAVDLLGHGASDAPEPVTRYAIEQSVQDVVDILDALGIERADWIGYSMGGRVALAAAVLRPSRVGRLVLESASPGLRDAEERALRRRQDDALAQTILDEGLEAFVDLWLGLPLFRSQRALPSELRAAERARRLGGSPPGLARSLRGLGVGSQPSFWDVLPRVLSPVLLLVGEQDTKFLRIAEEMANALRQPALIPIPGAGHAVHLERPRAWLEAVEGFLSGVA